MPCSSRILTSSRSRMARLMASPVVQRPACSEAMVWMSTSAPARKEGGRVCTEPHGELVGRGVEACRSTGTSWSACVGGHGQGAAAAACGRRRVCHHRVGCDRFGLALPSSPVPFPSLSPFLSSPIPDQVEPSSSATGSNSPATPPPSPIRSARGSPTSSSTCPAIFPTCSSRFLAGIASAPTGHY